MDTDGDGVLSMYELEFFYEEQAAKMEALGIEAMSFQDCLCQVRVVGTLWHYLLHRKPICDASFGINIDIRSNLFLLYFVCFL